MSGAELKEEEDAEPAEAHRRPTPGSPSLLCKLRPRIHTGTREFLSDLLGPRRHMRAAVLWGLPILGRGDCKVSK